MPRTHATLLAATFALNLALVGSSAADQWDNQFGLRGPEPVLGDVYEFWVSGSDLYAVGNFAVNFARDLARWDGTAWSDVGGLWFPDHYAALYGIVEHQGSLVVAGYSLNGINGQPGELALWNGTTWTVIHSPFLSGNDMFALESDGTNLYLGGEGGVVRYDGTTFESLAPAGFVDDLLWWDDRLYAVGNFTSLDGVTLNSVGYWDGTQWNALGTGTNISPGKVFVYDNEIYICGSSSNVINIRKWTGTQWVDAVTDNAPSCTPSSGAAIDATFFHGALYRTGVSGTTSPGGTSVTGAIKWTGSAWDDMDGGMEGSCYYSGLPGPLVEYNGRLFVAGGSTAGGMPSPGLAVWDGDRWYANAPDDNVRVLATAGSDVYLAGEFEMALDTPIHHVAKWDGSSWSALGSGVDGTIHDMVTIGPDLYVAGDFTDAGGSSADYIARWDGANWSAVGAAPVFGSVRALATDGVNLYVGGDFVMIADGTFPQRVAKWDGTSWNALGGGITNGSVEALECHDGDLFAGGTFTSAENTMTGNVVRWDGDAWTTLDGGLTGLVRDLEFHSGVLHAGGDFTNASMGTLVNRIAAWNGVSWESVDVSYPKGLDAPVRAIASVGAMLYVAGDFATAGGTPVGHIACWDGTDWRALGSGLNAPGDALAIGAGALFVGGQFSLAGGLGSHRFASWMLTPTTVAATRLSTTILEPAFPNPFNPETHIRYRVAQTGRITIAIYDAHGRRVRALLDETYAGSPNQRTITWDGNADDGSRVASGVYFVRMTAPAFEQSQKIVLLK